MTIDLDLVRAFHRREVEASDEALDAALGLPPRTPTGQPFEDEELVRRHPGESFADLPTPYVVARDLFEVLHPTEDDVVLDLGCAMGRVVLYGGVVTGARLVGIEIVEERAAIAAAAVEALGLAPRVSIVAGNVLAHDLSRATIVYMFRPFGEATEAEVVRRLHDEARRRPLTVATMRMNRVTFDPDVFDAVATGTLTVHGSARGGGPPGRSRG